MVSRMTRRQCLFQALGTVAAMATGSGACLASPAGNGMATVVRRGKGLGTTISMTARHASRDRAEQALRAAFAELELVEGVMSLYRSDSQLARLNRDGRIESPHPWLREIITYARELSAATDGAFDISVQPLWDLYFEAHKAHRLPTPREVDQRRSLVDWRSIRVEADAIFLERPGAALTLNGIAQGYAVDRVTAVLRNHGIEHALIDTGEIGGLGIRDDGERWTVGIQHPRRDDAFIAIAPLDDRCLATSGDYATRFEGDTAHHIFDPRTGWSPTELASVSVVAPTGMEADGLSTAIFVLGVERGLELLAQRPRVDAKLVTKDGTIWTTRGFPTGREGT